MAKFQKGEGGRRKGSVNKTTVKMRKWVSDFVDTNREQIQQDWLALEPKDRIIVFEKLMRYVLPTLQSIQNDNHDKKEIKVTVVRTNPAQTPQAHKVTM